MQFLPLNEGMLRMRTIGVMRIGTGSVVGVECDWNVGLRDIQMVDD
jgi:hypothetical protein